MKNNGVVHNGATRIHAVILTKDRPHALKRCVDAALSTLRAEDELTILDDSCAAMSRSNAEALLDANRSWTAQVTHLRSDHLHDAISQAMDGHSATWQSKTAPRDIAPLRNLSLLISAAVDARTTVLIDDDICGFDLDATHEMLDTLGPTPGGLVAGAMIGGTIERDTVTRLSVAMHLLQTTARNTAMPVENLFRVPSGGDDRDGDACGCVSAGYLAFRLPSARMFAFPPGYNEDWLWCLLHGAGGDARVFRPDQTVVHDPPFIRRPSRDDILFEIAGDFVFDCLAAFSDGKSRGPEAALKGLLEHAPDSSFMPSVRVETVLKQALQLSEHGHGRMLSKLESYGLRILGDMQRSGDFEIDGSKMLCDWSGDAVVKQRSFAATLASSEVETALRVILQEAKL